MNLDQRQTNEQTNQQTRHNNTASYLLQTTWYKVITVILLINAPGVY